MHLAQCSSGISGMFATASKKKETEQNEDTKKEIDTTKTDTSKKQVKIWNFILHFTFLINLHYQSVV